MKNKFCAFGCAVMLSTVFLCGCGGSTPSSSSVKPSTSIEESSKKDSSSEKSSGDKSSSSLEPSLPDITNLKYEDGVLSFDPVEGATAYQYCFKHKDEVVYEDVLEDTSVDCESLGLQGAINVTICAINETQTGKPASLSFTILSIFNEAILEAENYLYNFGTGKTNSNFRNNPLASNGAYVGGLDDAGHGIYINYLSPFAGEFLFESHYCYQPTVSGITKAHHDIIVNGQYQSTFLYTENTGWGGATFNPAVANANVELQKGWNTICIMKNGNQADNWGDFAEIDFIRIVGNGLKYNVDDLEVYGERPTKYRLEAEMGSPRKKGASGMYECKNPCIKGTFDEYSNGFLMGGVEQKYDGVEWHFDSSVHAKYKISIAYASGEFEGSKKARPSFVVTQEPVGLSKNIDFLEHNPQMMQELDYTGWNNVTVAEETIELELEQGDNFIYCIILEGSGFFQIDYCDLVFVSEIE